VIVGSPPCQGFSNEGYKRSDDPRNSLVSRFLDIVETRQPYVWVFENVPGFRRLYGGHHFDGFAERLDDGPYAWTWAILDASGYGVPQRRKRFVAIGARDFAPSLPEPTYSAELTLESPTPLVTLWDAISDLPVVEPGERVGCFEYESPASSDYQVWAREDSPSVVNHTTQNHSARVLEKIRSIPEGEGMQRLVNEYAENRVKYEGGYRRALKHEPSYTAYWTRGMTSIHPEQHRFLTPRECARIQSFPDRYVFHGTTIRNYTQICNAVPPLLARAIGSHLLKATGVRPNAPTLVAGQPADATL
jgi:DNA (cytosine-5)-methyltransferase 1